MALATESPRLGGAEAPPFSKGASSLHSKGSLAKGSWHGAAVTEGFTVGTPPKYKPVWKGEGFLVNSEEGIGKKFRRLCLRNPPASAVPRHPPFDKGGFVLSTYCTAGSLAKGSWQKSLIFD